jgi:heme-degrading monooxygenase HmoA
MAVLMTFRAVGDPAELERRAAANPAGMQAIVEKAKPHGLISHRFYASDDGTIMVLDEWETEAGFRAFFSDSPEIQEMMAEVGVSVPPEVKFWRELETHDRVDARAT